MRRVLTAAAVAVLAVAPLSACGGSGGGDSDSTQSYCSSVKEAKAKFANLDSPSPAQIADVAKTIHGLASSAPERVKDDWAKLDGAFNGLKSTLSRAGLSLGDLGNQKKLMAKLQAMSPSEQRKFLSDLKSFNSADFQRAGDNISKEVKADCGFKLGD